MRILPALLAVLFLSLASCAQHNGNGFEPTVKVKGQYDASFGVVKRP